jgi:hypothetical protein
MYCIIDESTEQKCQWGPKIWDKHEIQNFIYGQYNIDFPVGWANPTDKVYEVNENVKIYPTRRKDDPAYNGKTQYLDGPYWDIVDNVAWEYYQVADRTVDMIRSHIKNKITENKREAERWGVIYNINDEEYYFKCSSEEISNFKNGVPGNWKLNRVVGKLNGVNGLNTEGYTTIKTFVEMSQDDLNGVVSAIQDRIQLFYDIEKELFDECDAATTTEELNLIPYTQDEIAERYNS